MSRQFDEQIKNFLIKNNLNICSIEIGTDGLLGSMLGGANYLGGYIFQSSKQLMDNFKINNDELLMKNACLKTAAFFKAQITLFTFINHDIVDIGLLIIDKLYLHKISIVDIAKDDIRAKATIETLFYASSIFNGIDK